MEISKELWYGFLIIAAIGLIAFVAWRKSKNPTSRGVERKLQQKRDEQSSKYFD